jgi:hypothetical protein
MTSTILPSGPRFGLIGLVGASVLTSEVGAEPSFPDGAPSASIGLSLPG